jgi:hypothetical protein
MERSPSGTSSNDNSPGIYAGVTAPLSILGRATCDVLAAALPRRKKHAAYFGRGIDPASIAYHCAAEDGRAA